MTAAMRHRSIECTVYTAVRISVAIHGVRTDGRAGARNACPRLLFNSKTVEDYLPRVVAAAFSAFVALGHPA